MDLWKAIVVGIVQGLAEFLPISSSGHIVLTQFLLGMRGEGVEFAPDLGFEVVVHVGTLISVLIFFRASLWKLTQSLYTKSMVDERKMIVYLGLATVPAVIAVKLFKDFFENSYGDPVQVSALLLVTGALLFVPRFLKGREREVGWSNALIMGCAQALAILPGISRSGSTIAAGLAAGVKPAKAAEFSFLMSIPAIAGGMVLTLKDRISENKEGGMATGEAAKEAVLSLLTAPYVAGAVAAAIVGLLAIYLVMGAVKRGKIEYFAYYCFAAGISGVLYFSLV